MFQATVEELLLIASVTDQKIFFPVVFFLNILNISDPKQVIQKFSSDY